MADLNILIDEKFSNANLGEIKSNEIPLKMKPKEILQLLSLTEFSDPYRGEVGCETSST